MREQLEQLIGKNFYAPEAVAANWVHYWPVVDSDAVITGIVDADEIDDNATLLEDDNGQLVETDGSFGFDAVMQ